LTNSQVKALSITILQPFDAINGTGLFAFTWNAGVPAGTTNFGNVVVSAEWWNGDPFTSGEFVEGATDAVVPFSVSVPVSCNCAPEQVPEPSSLALLFCGFGALLLFHRSKLSPVRYRLK